MMKLTGSTALAVDLNAAKQEITTLRAQLDAVEAKNALLRDAIAWALGERGIFGEEPPPLAGKYRRRYWWRTELRNRAGAAYRAQAAASQETR